ncbi:MAG: F0F1 ATP synthase subunit epsilon [Holosporales bacterium]|jgi:F-type H+-transporting ATPase subunit epsilon
MSELFLTEIITPEKTVFSGKVALTTVPATEGQMGVMAHHAPLLASLEEGEIVLTRTLDGSGTPLRHRISGGFVEIGDNRCTILAERLI